MATKTDIDNFLDSVIQAANYLRNVVDIPDNEDFRSALMDSIREADSALDDAASMVNEFDLSEWEN